MGNSKQPNYTQYKSIKKDNHPVLGLIEVIQAFQSSLPKRFTVKVKTYTNNHQLQTALKKIEKGKQVCQSQRQSHILNILHIMKKQTSGYCSNIRQLQVLYQEIQQDLYEQFLFKKCNKYSYSEEQVLNIITQLLQALKLAQEKQVRLFHISNKSILKRRQNNYCLIAHQDAQCLHPIDQYTHNFNGDLFSKDYYLSPKQLININKSYIPSQYNTKDHIFTLGINILNLCLMKEITFESDIISVKISEKEKYFTFEQNLVKKQVIKIKKILSQISYSNKLKQIIQKMIEFEQQNRLKYQQFYQIINKISPNQPLVDLTLKKTLKILQYKPFQSKQNINLIAPSLEDLQPKHKERIADVFIDAKHLFQDNNTSIATLAKDYKRAKLSTIKVNSTNQHNIISQQPNSPSIITPIKKLNDQLIFDDQSNYLLKGIKYGQAESIYGIQSNRTIKNSLASKTSFALNLHNK